MNILDLLARGERPPRVFQPRGRILKVEPLEEEPHPAIGLDLGQRNDPTAIAYAEIYPVRRVIKAAGGENRVEETVVYLIRRLERYLDVSYVDITERVVDMIMNIGGDHQVMLAVDIVGVGQSVRDMISASFRERAQASQASGGKRVRMKPAWVYTTAGGSITVDRGQLNVPRRELVYSTLSAMEDGRVSVGEVRNKDVLEEELRTMAVKVKPQTGHESYEHYRESDHDDLATAVMLPILAAEKFIVPGVRARYRIQPKERPMKKPGDVAPEPYARTPITGQPVPPPERPAATIRHTGYGAGYDLPMRG